MYVLSPQTEATWVQEASQSGEPTATALGEQLAPLTAGSSLKSTSTSTPLLRYVLGRLLLLELLTFCEYNYTLCRSLLAQCVL